MSEPGPALRSRAGRWIVATTVLGSGMAMLDATVVNVALERIGATFGSSFAGLQWTVNAYTLTLAGLILLGGSLGDRFGRRRVFVLGVIWFALASALCGLAPSIGVLVAARALQGVGGALLTPGSLALISASFHGRDRAAAIGAWSGLAGVAGAVGPFVGGWLVEWSWRAVFLVNLPVAAVVVGAALRHVPESSDPGAAARLDVAGTLLAVAGLGAVTWALTTVGARGATTAVGVVGGVGVVLLAAFVVVERRTRSPLVPGELFGDARFTATNVITLLVYAALGVVSVLLVLQLQVAAGFRPLVAGTAMLPVTIVMLGLSARAGTLAQRIGPRIPMTMGLIVAAVGQLLLLRVGPGADYLTDVLPAVTVFGLGLAATVSPLTATVLDAADDRHAGVASAVNNAIARAANLVALAVIPALAGITGAAYTDPAAFSAGYHRALLIAAGLLVAGALLSAVLLGPHPPRLGRGQRLRVERSPHCGVQAPASCPAPASVGSASGDPSAVEQRRR